MGRKREEKGREQVRGILLILKFQCIFHLPEYIRKLTTTVGNTKYVNITAYTRMHVILHFFELGNVFLYIQILITVLVD